MFLNNSNQLILNHHIPNVQIKNLIKNGSRIQLIGIISKTTFFGLENRYFC